MAAQAGLDHRHLARHLCITVVLEPRVVGVSECLPQFKAQNAGDKLALRRAARWVCWITFVQQKKGSLVLVAFGPDRRGYKLAEIVLRQRVLVAQEAAGIGVDVLGEGSSRRQCENCSNRSRYGGCLWHATQKQWPLLQLSHACMAITRYRALKTEHFQVAEAATRAMIPAHSPAPLMTRRLVLDDRKMASPAQTATRGRDWRIAAQQPCCGLLLERQQARSAGRQRLCDRESPVLPQSLLPVCDSNAPKLSPALWRRWIPAVRARRALSPRNQAWRRARILAPDSAIHRVPKKPAGQGFPDPESANPASPHEAAQSQRPQLRARTQDSRFARPGNPQIASGQGRSAAALFVAGAIGGRQSNSIPRIPATAHSLVESRGSHALAEVKG